MYQNFSEMVLPLNCKRMFSKLIFRKQGKGNRERRDMSRLFITTNIPFEPISCFQKVINVFINTLKTSSNNPD